MPHLKKYPTRDDVINLTDHDKLEQGVLQLSEYSQTQELARLSESVKTLNTSIMYAWGALFAAIQEEMPDAHLNRDWTITRKLTHDELFEIVIDHERSNRYYHYDKYAEYTEHDIAE
jgi:hypothetical protein